MSEANRKATALLDLIRSSEAEVTRMVAAARESTAKEIAAARERVQEQLSQAEERGRVEGELQRQTALQQADEEAHKIVSQAGVEAERLRGITPAQIAVAVDYAVKVVIGDESTELSRLTEEGLIHEA